MVVDCDVHQGNGTAAIFKEKNEVFTFSIHEQDNYPAIKPSSDLDINLPTGVGDKEYLNYLRHSLPSALDEFSPQLVFYIAGADPYLKDQLGGLNLSLKGLEKRDEYVYELIKQRGIALVIVLGGGYALDIDDTITIHYNTAKKALEVFG